VIDDEDDVDDGSDKPVGYTTPDGHLEVRQNEDGTRSYHETELGQHDRWMRQAPDLYALYVDSLVPRPAWYMQTKIGCDMSCNVAHRLTLRDRLRVLFGVPIVVAFRTPDGRCHGACTMHARVQHDWFDNELLRSGKVDA
jgi:hypothetical protein